jgi:hypothetical protein
MLGELLFRYFIGIVISVILFIIRFIFKEFGIFIRGLVVMFGCVILRGRVILGILRW